MNKLSSNRTARATAEEVELATFYVADLLLGIPICDVEEICRYSEVTPVPGAPDSVCGLVSLRGEVVTVLDLREVVGLGKTEITRQTRNMIISAGGERIGLLVDRVADVVRAAAADLLPPPANVNGIDGTLFKAVYRMESELLVLVDLDEVTAVPENA